MAVLVDRFRINRQTIKKLYAKRKGQLLLLEVVRELRSKYDIHLTILGSIPNADDPNYSRITELIARHGIDNVVELEWTVQFKRDAAQVRTPRCVRPPEYRRIRFCVPSGGDDSRTAGHL